MKDLDITILRFAHAFDSGAGVETYLEDLDRMLLKKNPWTIIRMYLTEDKKEKAQKKEIIGRGKLIKVPLFTERSEKMELLNIESETEVLMGRLKKFYRDHIVYNPVFYALFFRNIMRKRTIPKRMNEALNAAEVSAQLMSKYKIDLLVMHYASGNDSAAVIGEAIQRNIPYVFINHFSNDCLNSASIREQTSKAAKIAGVSNVNVPKRLQKSFVNLSDGIDVEYFNNCASKPSNENNDIPIVLLPARVTPSKGQRDLVLACAKLRREGIKLQVAFAGRADSKSYIQELRDMAFHLGVEHDVLFLGQLSSEQLREWYNKSSIMAFPTYHHEGLPRVLIETQAMDIPPISYVIGGTPNAIVHGKTGFLVKKGDVDEFTERLRELLSDEQKRRHMGIMGRKFVEKNFSLQAFAERHEKFYSHVLKNASNN